MNRNAVIIAVIVIAGAALIAPRFLDSNQFHDLEDETPRFVTHEFTQLEKIGQISKFRSGAGHDFSDDSETCRSMKHYYAPKPEHINNEIEIYSPVDGFIVEMWEDQRGEESATDHQVHIQSEEYPAFTIRLFHVIIDDLNVGDEVEAGQFLGYAYMADQNDHVANDFDIAVHVRTRDGRRYIPYFDILSDEVFQAYIDRGATSRAQFIITKEERDANPLSCDGEWFTTSGSDADWVQLN